MATTSGRNVSQCLGLELIERGLSCLPLGSSKRPARKWAEWQSRLPTPAEVQSWGTSEVGVITGLVSDLVVVDCYSMADAAWALANLAPTPCQVRTPTGVQLFFRHPGGVVRNAVRVQGRFSVRGDGNFTVAPRRNHWHRGGWSDLPRCPVFDPSWLPADTRPLRVLGIVYGGRWLELWTEEKQRLNCRIVETVDLDNSPTLADADVRARLPLSWRELLDQGDRCGFAAIRSQTPGDLLRREWDLSLSSAIDRADKFIRDC